MQQLFPAEGESVPRLRFPEFEGAGEWEEKTIRELISTSFYGTSSSTSDSGAYPVIRMGNMQDGRIDFTNMTYIDFTESSFLGFKLENGDILLNRTNSFDLVGKVSLFDSEGNYMTASYIVTYRPDQTKVIPRFLNFSLNTQLKQNKIREISTKSVNQANINPTTFQNSISVATPTLPEQIRIADCLSSIDTLISAQTDKIAELKTFKRGLMQQLFPAPDEGEE
jgi:type I restriction enzyme, S subunit